MLQRAIRSALYAARRNSFGCEVPECTCAKHLVLPGLDEADPDYGPRIHFLTRLESMVAVGCRFTVNDLTPVVWSELILLAKERAWMDAQVDEKREALRDVVETERKNLDAARKEAKVPPPGQSVFRGGA